MVDTAKNSQGEEVEEVEEGEYDMTPS